MKVLIFANFGMGLYKFRKELLNELILQNHEVYISLPNDEYVPMLIALGCKFVETPVDRRGINPITDLKLFLRYLRMIKHINPDVTLSYTIKPNVYGGIACRLTKASYISNITGLGTSLQGKGIIRTAILTLYRAGLRKASCVFFQNTSNREFFIENNIIDAVNTRLIPGSGVNLDQHKFEEYPDDDGTIRFLFIGRIMRAKGIEELIQAAKIIKMKYPSVYFDVVGGMEEDYTNQLADMDARGIIRYYGQQDDVHSFIMRSHATILPSYHEGLANVLLESASVGRPVLASRVPGCIETFDDGNSGFSFEAGSVSSLTEAMIRFINLSYDEKRVMGINGRLKMQSEFDRNMVIRAYMEEINKTASSIRQHLTAG